MVRSSPTLTVTHPWLMSAVLQLAECGRRLPSRSAGFSQGSTTQEALRSGVPVCLSRSRESWLAFHDTTKTSFRQAYITHVPATAYTHGGAATSITDLCLVRTANGRQRALFRYAYLNTLERTQGPSDTAYAMGYSLEIGTRSSTGAVDRTVYCLGETVRDTSSVLKRSIGNLLPHIPDRVAHQTEHILW